MLTVSTIRRNGRELPVDAHIFHPADDAGESPHGSDEICDACIVQPTLESGDELESYFTRMEHKYDVQ